MKSFSSLISNDWDLRFIIAGSPLTLRHALSFLMSVCRTLFDNNRRAYCDTVNQCILLHHKNYCKIAMRNSSDVSISFGLHHIEHL